MMRREAVEPGTVMMVAQALDAIEVHAARGRRFVKALESRADCGESGFFPGALGPTLHDVKAMVFHREEFSVHRPVLSLLNLLNISYSFVFAARHRSALVNGVERQCRGQRPV